MNRIRRQGHGAAALLLGCLGVLIAAGGTTGACALPVYSIGDVTTGSGAGGDTAGAGGMTASTSVGNGGAGGHMTGGGGMTGTGGDGGTTTMCSTPADCGAPPSVCKAFECNSGQCVGVEMDGDYLKEDKINPNGDCSKAVCSGGLLTYQADASDTPLDKWVCHQNTCSTGYIDHSPLAVGTGCTIPGTNLQGKCDVGGRCVECLQPSLDCGSCVEGKCIGDACMNQVKDPNESDIDCGGSCVPCPPPKKCNTGADCQYGVCDANTCVTPNYSDGVKNGPETDVDCGGPAPKKCAAGQACAGNTDCVSGLCKKGACQFTCWNDVQDAEEDGVDCGGAACPQIACPP